MAATVKASALLPYVKKAYAEKWGYIWGGSGQVHTQAAQDSATREQTIKWGQKWVGKRVADCSGLFSWAYKQCGGYMYHGSNTIWNKYTTSRKGTLLKGKRSDGGALKPGCAVFLVKNGNRHHIGFYIGNGEVIEAKGTYYGVVKSKVSAWDEWAELVNTVYDVTEGGSVHELPVQDNPHAGSTTPSKSEVMTMQTIRKGSRGTQVKVLQWLLNENGFDAGKVDGIFGSGTEKALKAYQAKKGLTADGICGKNTWNTILA